MFQVIAVGLLSFGVLFVSQTYNQCTAQDPLEPVNTNFDLSKVYNMPWSEVQKNFVSIIETMKKEKFNNLKYFNQSEFVRFSLTSTHDENSTFILERWNDVCNYFLDEGCMEHFKLYVLDRFPATKTTWWGRRPSSRHHPNHTTNTP